MRVDRRVAMCVAVSHLAHVEEQGPVMEFVRCLQGLVMQPSAQFRVVRDWVDALPVVVFVSGGYPRSCYAVVEQVSRVSLVQVSVLHAA